MPVLATSRRAEFDYEILETYEAGLELFGFEVKSVRADRMNLAGAFVLMRGGEAWLVNAAIPPYQAANTPAGYDPERPRKLLLHRRELKELIGKSAQKGLTLVALRVYTKGPRIKIAFGLARRKKTYDKRERIREREDRKKIERTLRER
ncbi:MAG: SsrA-binding protein SmpB [Candidatus Sungbacteria bacterium]|uniref:SsrA-binding protein n=1 Tax=Candidatus Sungiibacteriota bacterium TaxID=2750080 RepID=A0A932YXN8_9BACT|nr:SsrA-binding protein SmpB [Candidatus Sungbacteria bacterium]